MCLCYANKINPEKDIICYKIFVKKKSTDNLHSVYYDYIWETNVLQSTHTDEPDFYQNKFDKSCVCIDGHAFHTFKFLEDAKQFKQQFNNYKNFVIYECVIPKTSKFVYLGVFGTLPSYASEKLLVKKMI